MLASIVLYADFCIHLIGEARGVADSIFGRTTENFSGFFRFSRSFSGPFPVFLVGFSGIVSGRMNHRKLSGQPLGEAVYNVSFQYLQIFVDEDDI